jgi:hypothetical protein
VRRRTGRDVGQLGSEGSGARGVSKLDLGRLVVLVGFGELVGDGGEIELQARSISSQLRTLLDSRGRSRQEDERRTLSIGFLFLATV